MPTNLTGNTIASTFDQLLHVDDGPTATEKTVYSGTGVATALKVGTESVSVENIRLDGNTISTLNTNGNLTLAPNGTGSVAIARAPIRWWLKLTGFSGITLPPLGIYVLAEHMYSDRLIRHEQAHWRQWQRMGTNYLNGHLASISYYDSFSEQIYTRRKNKAVFSLL